MNLPTEYSNFVGTNDDSVELIARHKEQLQLMNQLYGAHNDSAISGMESLDARTE